MYLHTHLALFAVAKQSNNKNHPMFNRRGMVKERYIYSMEYYAINKKEEVLCTLLQDDLKNIS